MVPYRRLVHSTQAADHVNPAVRRAHSRSQRLHQLVAAAQVSGQQTKWGSDRPTRKGPVRFILCNRTGGRVSAVLHKGKRRRDSNHGDQQGRADEQP